MSAQGVHEVDWLLSINLPRNACNKVLNIKNNLEDLHICLSTLIIRTVMSKSIGGNHSHHFRRHLKKLLPLLNTTSDHSANTPQSIPRPLTWTHAQAQRSSVACNQSMSLAPFPPNFDDVGRFSCCRSLQRPCATLSHFDVHYLGPKPTSVSS